MNYLKEESLVPPDLLQVLLRPISDAGAALARLNERIARSPVGKGWIERSHFIDACASLWVDGELVHLEDLVLRDAGADIRAPTHELTIAHDVLRTRRRIAAHAPGWALGAEGLMSLLGREGQGEAAAPVAAAGVEAEMPGATDEDDPFADELAAVDAVLARSSAVLAGTARPASAPRAERDTLVYDPDWDEEDRLARWRMVLSETEDLPPVLRAALLLDAWTTLDVRQRAPWLGRLLAASCLRGAGLTTAHLAAVNLGLRNIARERRTSRNRETRLLAYLSALTSAAAAGLAEHDRLALARQMLERRLAGRRQSSKLPALIDLVVSRPLVSGEMIARTLDVAPRSALRLVEELGLREITGRGRFRAWAVV